MKIRSGTKIAVGFLALAAILYFGYQKATESMIMGEKFAPVTPGTVNIVGIDPGAGYRIVVANSIAQLVQGSTDFEGQEGESEGATSGAIKKRLPIKELIQTLQGNREALGRFIMIINDIREDDTWPTIRVVWKAEDLRKAFEGDAALRAKLERDINMKLDGTPLATLNFVALENGIMVDYPVPIQVNQGGRVQEMIGRVQQPYKPRLLKTVEKQYENKNVDRAMQAGTYAIEAEKALSGDAVREKVQLALEQIISPDNAKALAETPERVLRHATVVVNEGHITEAGYDQYASPDGKPLFNLRISLNDEGRRRLWQYSMHRIGTHVLLVNEGVAIAAARIQHQLAQGQLTISHLDDEVLLREAVKSLNKESVAQR
ncbi:MAG TPA: hypothetical protein VGE01_11680 [Fimbriimonas sp.]